MRAVISLDKIITKVIDQFGVAPDHRTGQNTSYPVSTALSVGLSIFYTQSGSIYNHYNTMLSSEESLDNIKSLFKIRNEKIPTANTVRNILDGLEVQFFNPIYRYLFDQVKYLKDNIGKYVFTELDGKYLIAIDASQFHSSYNINCEHCCTKKHSKQDNIKTEYIENVSVASLISIKYNKSFILDLEFIRNNYGFNKTYNKQDCEVNATKRVIPRVLDKIPPNKVVFLGDDIYSRQPLIELISKYPGASFIFTCKESSHKSLYEDIKGLKLHELNIVNNLKNGDKQEIKYQWINNVPLNGNKNTINVNYVIETETTIFKNDIKEVKYAYATNMPLDSKNIAKIVEAGRARWKIENGNFNILKNQGYNFEHNYGHGKKTLAAVFICLCAIAFNLHVLTHFINLYKDIKDRINSNKALSEKIRIALHKKRYHSFIELFLSILRDLNATPSKIHKPPG